MNITTLQASLLSILCMVFIIATVVVRLFTLGPHMSAIGGKRKEENGRARRQEWRREEQGQKTMDSGRVGERREGLGQKTVTRRRDVL